MNFEYEEALASRSAWSVVLLPDIQNYTGKPENFSCLIETLDWIVSERERLKIKALLQLGDLTNRNQTEEWQRVRKAFRILDEELPYIFTVGNHDLGVGSVGATRETLLNDFLRPDDNPLNHDAFVSFQSEGCLENTASLLNLSGTEWLILALEFGPREEVIDWAQEVLTEHAKKPTILLTHEFLDQLSVLISGEPKHSHPETNNSPYAYGIALEQGGVHCGEELWDLLVKPHNQIRLVVNGHYRPYWRNEETCEILPLEGVADVSRTDVRSDGSLVHQHLFNAQWAPNGGDGWIKLIYFDAEGMPSGSFSLTPRLLEARV